MVTTFVLLLVLVPGAESEFINRYVAVNCYNDRAPPTFIWLTPNDATKNAYVESNGCILFTASVSDDQALGKLRFFCIGYSSSELLSKQKSCRNGLGCLKMKGFKPGRNSWYAQAQDKCGKSSYIKTASFVAQN